ncbi:MAG: hypothetical protein ACC700_16665 [Anaerolineales bacterium]
MLEMLEPIATALGYILLIPALVFAAVLFLCATITLLFLALRWLSKEQLRRKTRVMMTAELGDLKWVSRATPEEVSKICSASSLSDAEWDYID